MQKTRLLSLHCSVCRKEAACLNGREKGSPEGVAGVTAVVSRMEEISKHSYIKHNLAVRPLGCLLLRTHSTRTQLGQVTLGNKQ